MTKKEYMFLKAYEKLCNKHKVKLYGTDRVRVREFCDNKRKEIVVRIGSKESHDFPDFGNIADIILSVNSGGQIRTWKPLSKDMIDDT